MNSPFQVSPLLDGITIGVPMQPHYGVCSYPAVQENTDNRYIVKQILIPPSQAQVEAFLITGAYRSPEQAEAYFQQMAQDVIDEAAFLETISQQGGFLPPVGYQLQPQGNHKFGFGIYLLTNFRVSLSRYMHKHPISHLEAVNLGIDMCHAMALCRKAGKMYVDLKPSNIFVSSKKGFKIGDLGFVDMNSMQYLSMPARYISAYTAPELRSELNTLNATADTYSLGMLLYQVFNNGKLPLNTADLVPPANGDSQIRAIIMKACDPNPEKRWSSPTQMGQALIAYLQTGSVNHTQIMAPIASEKVQSQPDTKKSDIESITSDATKVIPVIKALPTANEGTVTDETIVVPTIHDEEQAVSGEEAVSIPSAPSAEAEIPAEQIVQASESVEKTPSDEDANSENASSVMETDALEKSMFSQETEPSSEEIQNLFSMLEFDTGDAHHVLTEIDLEFPVPDNNLTLPSELDHFSIHRMPGEPEQLGFFPDSDQSDTSKPSTDKTDTVQTSDSVLQNPKSSTTKLTDSTKRIRRNNAQESESALNVTVATASAAAASVDEPQPKTLLSKFQEKESDTQSNSKDQTAPLTDSVDESASKISPNVPVPSDTQSTAEHEDFEEKTGSLELSADHADSNVSEDSPSTSELPDDVKSVSLISKLKGSFFTRKGKKAELTASIADEPTHKFSPVSSTGADAENQETPLPDKTEQPESILDMEENTQATLKSADLTNVFRTEVIPEEEYDDWDEEVEQIQELETISSNSMDSLEHLLSTPAPVPEIHSEPTAKPKPEKKRKKEKHRVLDVLIAFLLGFMMLTTAVGAYFFYFGYFLQTVNELHITGSQMELTVFADTLAEDGLLTAICTDPNGNEISRDIYHGKAIFTDLTPNTQYTIRIEIKGLHQLKGQTNASFTTEDIAEIQDIQILTGAEDGSALVYLVVDGYAPEQWHLQYSAENEIVHNAIFSGNQVTVTGLTVGSEYTFEVEPEDGTPVKGITMQTHTAANVILPQNLKIASWENDTLVLEWESAEESPVYWSVSCFNDSAQIDIDTEETEIAIPGVTVGNDYTVEVTSAGMSQGAQLKLSANPIHLSSISASVQNGKDLLLTWQSDQGDPADGWQVSYTIDGHTEATLSCPSSAVTITPMIPNAMYDFSIQSADGTTVFGGAYSHTMKDGGMYVGHAVSGYQIRTTLLATPSRAGWTNANTSVAEFTDPITPGRNMSAVLHVLAPFYLNEEDVTMVFVVRDENGKVVPESTATRTADWSNMWDKEDYHFASMNIGKAPNQAGKYTLTIYFNGKFVNETKFTVS